MFQITVFEYTYMYNCTWCYWNSFIVCHLFYLFLVQLHCSIYRNDASTAILEFSYLVKIYWSNFLRIIFIKFCEYQKNIGSCITITYGHYLEVTWSLFVSFRRWQASGHLGFFMFSYIYWSNSFRFIFIRFSDLENIHFDTNIMTLH